MQQWHSNQQNPLEEIKIPLRRDEAEDTLKEREKNVHFLHSWEIQTMTMNTFFRSCNAASIGGFNFLAQDPHAG